MSKEKVGEAPTGRSYDTNTDLPIVFFTSIRNETIALSL
jgi:hypothetical protein